MVHISSLIHRKAIPYVLMGIVMFSLVSGMEFRYRHDDGTQYILKNNGYLAMKKPGQLLHYFGFALSGTYQNNNYFYSVDQGTWKWSKTNYTYSSKKGNETDNYNSTYTVFYHAVNFSGILVKNNLQVEQRYTFREHEPVKITIFLNHSLQRNITNTTFWFFYQVYQNQVIYANQRQYRINISDRLHYTQNLEGLLPGISLPGYMFQFQDLLDNNFVITDFYLGNGNILNRVGKGILALGITKNNGNFPPGMMIEIDPSSTGNIYPKSYGSIYNQWSNPENALLSDNIRATETTVGDREDYYNFTFNIPENATIQGIEVYVEACNSRISCSSPD